jgi:hypothetical protein
VDQLSCIAALNVEMNIFLSVNIRNKKCVRNCHLNAFLKINPDMPAWIRAATHYTLILILLKIMHITGDQLSYIKCIEFFIEWHSLKQLFTQVSTIWCYSFSKL